MNLKKDKHLKKIGINIHHNIQRNLSTKKLVRDIVDNKEGLIGLRGATMVDTGIYTGRSPKDRYIVEESVTKDKIWWGPVNRKISEKVFDILYKKI